MNLISLTRKNKAVEKWPNFELQQTMAGMHVTVIMFTVESRFYELPRETKIGLKNLRLGRGNEF